jgi:NADH-quinone oxidoreductase subunit K
MPAAIPLEMVLTLGGAVFCIGLFGALARRNAISILMGVELMFNAVNINLVAFWRYTDPEWISGQMFTLFIIVVAAAEATVGLAMVYAIYRTWQTVNVDAVDSLRG